MPEGRYIHGENSDQEQAECSFMVYKIEELSRFFLEVFTESIMEMAAWKRGYLICFL